MAKRLRGLWAALALGVLAPGVAIAAGPAPAAPEAATDQIETARPSRGKVTVAGRTIPYTVTPGTLIIRDDAAAPIVSVSLGVPAKFLWGGLRRSDRTRPIVLESGDVVVWGGASRFVYHGIAPLPENRHSLTGELRINLTFRKAH